MSTINAYKAQPLIPSHAEGAAAAPALFGGDGPGIDDFLDLINPLQHIPVVSSFYRAATGDQISAAASMIGGGLLGGLPGLISSAANAALAAATGKDAGQTALDALGELSDDKTESLYAAPAPVPLASDNGEAALNVLLAKATAAPEPVKASEAAPSRLRDLPDLRAAVNPTLGLDDKRKQEQFSEGLHKIALDMKS